MALDDAAEKKVFVGRDKEITPLLVIHGKNDKYCFPKYAQQVYEEAGEPKEILWLDTSNHIDLYDNEEYVSPATSKIIEWFGKYLVNR